MTLFTDSLMNADGTLSICRAAPDTAESDHLRTDTYVLMSGRTIAETELAMRFVIRNNPHDKTAPGLVIAAVMHAGGMIVGFQRIDAEDGYATRRIIESMCEAITKYVAASNDEVGVSATVTVTLPLRKAEREAALAWYDGNPENAWDAERMRVMSPQVTLRLADPEEAAPLPVPSVDPLAPIFASRDMPDMDEILALFESLESRLRTDPNARTFAVRDDIARRDETQYVFDADTWTSPRTAVLGAAGSGKSSLISALIDTAGHDLPPSGLSRTTLCPIVFHNDDKIRNFRLEVECHSVAHIKEAVRARIEEAALSALDKGVVSIGDRAARLLARSDDSTFDMRLVFGRMKRGNAAWQDILTMFNGVLDDLRLETDPVAACENAMMIDIVADDIAHRMFATLQRLSFGRHRLRQDGTTARFGYAATSRIAMIEAGRRFFSASLRHAGKSFAPLCKRITFRGDFVDAKPFILVDNRGFDHEGDLAQAAAADIMREVDVADRIMVIEDAAKVGARATMELIAQIVASGNGHKVFFVQSKADTVLEKGVDITRHVQAGLSNGLSALRNRVGDLAIAGLENNVNRGGVYHFGNLDRFDIPKGGLVNAAADDELGLDNAREARRMFFLMATDPAQGPAVDIASLTPTYDESLIMGHVRNAIVAAAPAILARYGEAGDNAGYESHWGTIKAENRRVVRALAADDPDTLDSELAAMSWIESVVLTEKMSLMLDRPDAWDCIVDDLDHAQLVVAQERVKADLRRSIASAIHRIVTRLSLWDPRSVWRDAFALTQVTFGKGSTFERSRLLRMITDGFLASAALISTRIAEDLMSSGATLTNRVGDTAHGTTIRSDVAPEPAPMRHGEAVDSSWEAFCADNWEMTEEEKIAAYATSSVVVPHEEIDEDREGDVEHA